MTRDSRCASPRRCGPGLTCGSSSKVMWQPETRSECSTDPAMISPLETYFGSTPAIAVKPNGCSRFRRCPIAGGGGQATGCKSSRTGAHAPRHQDVASSGDPHGVANRYQRIDRHYRSIDSRPRIWSDRFRISRPTESDMRNDSFSTSDPTMTHLEKEPYA